MSSGTLAFMHEFARQPMAVGAVAPSGSALTRQVTAPVPASGHPVVVELGPGTGAFTGAIQTRLAGRGQHVAVDVNERFTSLLAERYPRLDVVTADARDLASVIDRRADVVISGLPWAAFRQQQQREILDAVTGILTPDGAFTTFAYVHARWTPPARRFHRELTERFEEVVLGRTVWANVPPALVYHCRRPR
ncbi:MAG: methyltransferase domain-containing protein [Actinoplanes sp.]